MLYYILLVILYYISTPTSRTSKIEARRLQNRGPEVPKSRSGGSKIEVLGRHGGFLGRLGRLRASREAPERLQEAPRRRLGAVLGPSWGGLGRSWGDLGRSWGDLGWSWGGLGRSWGDLGRSWEALGRSWRDLGAPKSIFQRS